MLLSFLFAYFGFAALSLSKARHYQQVWPDQKLSDATTKILTIVGWILLALGSLPVFYAEKISIALTELLGILSIAGLLLVLQFAYLPRTIAGIGLIDASKKFLYGFIPETKSS